jgi:hypothetical protein
VLTDLPGQGDPLLLGPAAVAALVSGAAPALSLAQPGMRITITAEDLAPALPAPRPAAQILAFPPRA